MSLTKKVRHAFSTLFSTSFANKTVFNSFSSSPLLIVILNDILKVVRFRITESRGTKFELRQGVIETLDIYEPIDCPLKRAYPNCCILNYSV